MQTVTICFLSLAASVVGWGQRFEPLRGGAASCSALRAKKRDSDHDGPEDMGELMDFRQRLELTFAVFDGDGGDPIGSFIKGEGEEVEEDTSITAALDRMYSADVLGEEMPCDGDCDSDGECQIPESFKIVPGADSVDVMAFLGIQRAEPLKAKNDVGDWQ